MQKIQQIPINEIKFDPTQPRKFVDKRKVSNIAESILSQGVINPIEIDEDYVIVTGELRYRAAKEAGLETAPCKIIKIPKSRRFERQVIENIHNDTMTAWDTAKALKKLLGYKKGQTKFEDNRVTELAERIGKSESWVRTTIGLLESNRQVQDALKSNKISKSQASQLTRMNPELRKKLQRKVIDGEIVNYRTLKNIRHRINENPDKEDAILNVKFKGRTHEDIARDLEKVAKTKQELQWGENDYFETLEKVARDLTKLLADNPLGKSGHSVLLNEYSKKVVKSVLRPLPMMITAFNRGYDSQGKITSQVIDGEIV